MRKVLAVVALVAGMLVPTACTTQSSAEAYPIPWYVCNPGTHWVNDSYTLAAYRSGGFYCYQVPIYTR